MAERAGDLEGFGDNADAVLGLEKRSRYKSGGIQSELDRQKRALEESRKAIVGSSDRLPRAQNSGAYDDVRRRIRELVKGGYTQEDATRIAREEEKAGTLPARRRSDHDYLGDSVENLMAASVKPTGSGSSKGRRRKKPVSIDKDRLYDEILQDENSPAAVRLAAQAMQRMSQRSGMGPPLKGREPRIHIQFRMEPSDVTELYEMTGEAPGGFVERMVPVLRRIREGEGDDAMAAIRELLAATDGIDLGGPATACA